VWIVVAVLLSVAPVDVEQMRTVAGPFASLQSCEQVAQELAKVADEKPREFRVGCVKRGEDVIVH
jgi:hypothetical protein